MSRLKKKYQEEIAPKLARELGIKNKMAVPKVERVVINAGIGAVAKDKGELEKTGSNLAAITGQKPSIRPAKVSVAGFGIRAGMPVGLKVTLRQDRMYDFLDRLFSIVLPRLRDFRGVPIKSFDSAGNYTLGMEDYSVFPEVDLAKVPQGAKGLEITIVTNAEGKDKAKRLLELLGMPFEKE